MGFKQGGLILKIHIDSTNCVLFRSQISLNLRRLIDLAPFFTEKLQHEQSYKCCKNKVLYKCLLYYVAVVMQTIHTFNRYHNF